MVAMASLKHRPYRPVISPPARPGWWRKPRPIAMDFTTSNAAARLAKLAGLSADYAAVAAGLRERADTCIDWLGVAARSDR